MTEPMGERGRQGAAPLGGEPSDFETVRKGIWAHYSDDECADADAALSRIERVVEAADDLSREFGGIPEDDLFTAVGVTNANILIRKHRALREALGALDG